VYALCRRPKTAVYTASVHGRKWPCTRPVHCRVQYMSRYGPYTAVYTTRYTAVYGRVDGRFRPFRWPVHGHVTRPCTRRHVDTCTRPYTCPVHGRVHGPYTARGRVRSMYTAEDVRADGPYTVMYTDGVDGPFARPIHDRVRAVYTARPCTGRVYGTAVIRPCMGRFRGRRRVHGPCIHGRRVTGTRHVTRPCTWPCSRHVTRPCTRPVYTARTRQHNGRLDGR